MFVRAALHWPILLLGALSAAAHGALQVSDPAPSPIEQAKVATGTPSNANGTASPATIADAMVRTDDRLAAYTNSSNIGLSLGTAVAGGSFGSGQASSLWSTALGARYAVGALRLTASIPYLRVRGRGLIFSGIDATPLIVSGGTPGPKLTNEGIGDLTVGAAYTLPHGAGRPEVELSGRVKFPTARRSDQLSTGKKDYSAGVQVTQAVGRFGPFVSASYRHFGDPATIALRSGFAASAGSSLSVGERSVVLVSYHYARAATRLVRDSHELFAGASTRIADTGLRGTIFSTAGLSSGAAATSGGVSLAVEF